MIYWTSSKWNLYFCFFSLFGEWSVEGSVGVVRGPVRRWSTDPVRSGGPWTGGQCFRVTPLANLRNYMFMLLRVTADRSLKLTIRGIPQENLNNIILFPAFYPFYLSLERQKTPNTSCGKAREAYLLHTGQTLEQSGMNRRSILFRFAQPNRKHFYYK